MDREKVATVMYGDVTAALFGVRWACMDAVRALAMKLKAAGVGPDLKGITIERPPRDGDYRKLVAYREIA